MFKLNIFKNNEIVAEGEFETLQLANDGLSKGIQKEYWGKSAYTEIISAVTEMQEVVITPAELDAEGNIVTEAITEMQEVVISPETTIEHPAEFTYTIEDISTQIEAERKLIVRKDKRGFGEVVIDQLAVINETSNVSSATLEALILDPDFTVIKEFLWDGSLKSAYNKILAIEPKILTVFSQADLDLIKAKLLAKLQELGEI